MKKIMAISDLHGRTCWKDFGDIKFLLTAEPDAAGFGPYTPDFDLYVFLGDYTDSFTETNSTIKENLLEIIKFKTLYPKNVILLWGNHDVEYYINLPWLKMNGGISGFRPEMHYDLYDIFNTNKDKFQVAFKVNNYLFTHAGVHFGWYHYVFTKAIKGMGMNEMDIADQLNEAFKHNVKCLFDVDWYRGGSKKVGGPLWCGKQLMVKKPLKYCHQIVGHTPVDDFQKIVIGNSSITFCDVLHKKNEFYEINI